MSILISKPLNARDIMTVYNKRSLIWVKKYLLNYQPKLKLKSDLAIIRKVPSIKKIKYIQNRPRINYVYLPSRYKNNNKKYQYTLKRKKYIGQ